MGRVDSSYQYVGMLRTRQKFGIKKNTLCTEKVNKMKSSQKVGMSSWFLSEGPLLSIHSSTTTQCWYFEQ